MPGARRPWERFGAPVVVLVAAFAASRVAYRLAGVRFDASTLGTYVQFVDPELLRHHLASSIWYLHTQPPLYNLYLGVLLKAAGDSFAGAAHATYLLAGLALALAIYALLRRLGVAAWWSAAASALFAISPPVVLYENWLYVDYLVAAALTLAALLLVRFARSGRTLDAAAAFALLGGVSLARSMFHPLWLLAATVLVWALQPARRRRVLVAAAVPLLVCAGVYVKNAVLFGSPLRSSCVGVNLARVSTWHIDLAARRRLVAAGTLSRFALANPVALPVSDPAALRTRSPRGVPLLDRGVKSTGAVNWDSTAFERVCQRYADDAFAAVRARPGAFVHGVASGLLIYARPSSDYRFFSAGNRAAIHGLERAFAAVALGQLHRGPADARLGNDLASAGWLVLAGYALAVAAAVGTLRRARRERALDSPAALLAAFFLLDLAYVTLVGNVVESGENNRFRMVLDPLAFVLAVQFAYARWAPATRAAAARPGAARSGAPPRAA